MVKPRTSAKKNANIRRKRRQLKLCRTGLTEKQCNQRTPICLDLLSISQWKKILPFSVVVDPGTEAAVWQATQWGRFFSSKKCGAIVTKAKQLKSLPNEHPWKKHKFQLCGDDYQPNLDQFVLMAIWDREELFDKSLYFNSTSLVQQLSEVKPNTVKPDGKGHFQSRGKCHSYGSRGGYEKVENSPYLSSIREYATKRGLTEDQHITSESCRSLLINSIDHGISIIERLFAGTKGGSPVQSGTRISEAVVRTCHEVEEGLAEVISFNGKGKFASLHMNVNAETLDPHSEEDASLTMIYTPPQEGLEKVEQSPYSFNFYLSGKDDNHPIKVELNVGMTIFFSGFLLIHRQECTGALPRDIPMINCSAYTNKSLYAKARATIQRNLEETEFAKAKTKQRLEKRAKRRMEKQVRKGLYFKLDV